VEDADQPVGELAEGGVVADPAGAQGVVGGTSARRICARDSTAALAGSGAAPSSSRASGAASSSKASSAAGKNSRSATRSRSR
jgi:hypothetical protein